jgi:integrase
VGKASANRFKFSRQSLRVIEKRIDKGEFSTESYLYDSESHLAIRVRPNQSYIDSGFCLYARIRVCGQLKGQTYKRQLMKVGEARNSATTLTELRQQADNLFLEIQNGRDPQLLAQNAAEQQAREEADSEAKGTLKEMIYGTKSNNGEVLTNGFISERQLSPRYIWDFERLTRLLLSDLMDEPLYRISPEQIKTVYLQKVGRGTTQLHLVLRMLRSVWNWAQAKYDESDLFIRNPVSRAMKQLGVNINRTNRRSVRLDDDDFKPYLASVLNLRNHDHTSALRNGRDALLFMLFSGVRVTGTLTIRMQDIDLQRRCFTITKKGGERAELPLNSVTESIVLNRKKFLPSDCVYLFPGVGGRGRYRDTKSVREIIKTQSGIAVTNHDLRRTFKSLGTELGINQVLVDELLTHAREGVDAHYIHPSMTRLREASQAIADHIMGQAGIDVCKELLDCW